MTSPAAGQLGILFTDLFHNLILAGVGSLAVLYAGLCVTVLARAIARRPPAGGRIHG